MKNEIEQAQPLTKKTVVEQIARLACHFPNSGHTKDTIKVVAGDWYQEFDDMTSPAFVFMISNVLKKTRFFPSIADVRETIDGTGICQNCIYRKRCEPAKQYSKKQGLECDSFIKGQPQ